MNLAILGSLAGLCASLLVIESLGLRTTLALDFKGDVKRETRWLAQYGQSVSTAVAALLIFTLDPTHRAIAVILVAGVTAASIAALFGKRLIGRVRPGREQAGQFLGPTWKHANYRESFPSSHTACAVASSAVLAAAYPAGAPVFWGLAVICGGLRYILDAHYPSDVIGGAAVGYAAGSAAWLLMPYLHF